MRSFNPAQILFFSSISLSMVVAAGAIGHLISLDASVDLNPVIVEASKEEPEVNWIETLISSASTIANPSQTTTGPTDRERQNVAMTQLQDGDWLMKRGQLKAARGFYETVRDQADAESELYRLAVKRLDKLEQAIALAQQKAPKSAKPVAKTAAKPETDSKPDNSKPDNSKPDNSKPVKVTTSVISQVESQNNQKKSTGAINPLADQFPGPIEDPLEPHLIPQPDPQFETVQHNRLPVSQPEAFDPSPMSIDSSNRIESRSDFRVIPTTAPLPDGFGR